MEKVANNLLKNVSSGEVTFFIFLIFFLYTYKVSFESNKNLKSENFTTLYYFNF